MKFRVQRFLPILVCLVFSFSAVAAPITRIWLTHKTSEPTRLMVNWESKEPGASRVDYGASEDLGKSASAKDSTTLHHVEVPFPQSGLLHYRVVTGEEESAVHAVKAYAGESLRIAAAANWFIRLPLDGLLKDDPHLLLSCGDMVFDVVPAAPGEPVNTKPFSNLLDIYPELFARVPFLPALGNHDRQIRYLNGNENAGPGYDLEAASFRSFFPLPDDGRWYHFDIPAFGVRLAALDLSHIRDVGTPRQSCAPFDRNSEQFRWYRDLMRGRTQRFVVSYYNESNYGVRGAEQGAWETLLRQGSLMLSGFGSFAERAEVKGVPYFNSGLKEGEDFHDTANAKFFNETASYILMTIPKEGELMTVDLKGLDGTVLDSSQWPGRARLGNRQRPPAPASNTP